MPGLGILLILLAYDAAGSLLCVCLGFGAALADGGQPTFRGAWWHQALGYAFLSSQLGWPSAVACLLTLRLIRMASATRRRLRAICQSAAVVACGALGAWAAGAWTCQARPPILIAGPAVILELLSLPPILDASFPRVGHADDGCDAP